MTRMRQELVPNCAGGACIAFKGTRRRDRRCMLVHMRLSRLTEDASRLPKILAGQFIPHVRADVHQAQLAANELLRLRVSGAMRLAK
jgi:hypothetical protein